MGPVADWGAMGMVVAEPPRAICSATHSSSFDTLNSNSSWEGASFSAISSGSSAGFSSSGMMSSASSSGGSSAAEGSTSSTGRGSTTGGEVGASSMRRVTPEPSAASSDSGFFSTSRFAVFTAFFAFLRRVLLLCVRPNRVAIASAFSMSQAVSSLSGSWTP